MVAEVEELAFLQAALVDPWVVAALAAVGVVGGGTMVAEVEELAFLQAALVDPSAVAAMAAAA
jgi:hypothetical protein